MAAVGVSTASARRALWRSASWPPPLVLVAGAVASVVVLFALLGDSGVLGDPYQQDLSIGASSPSGLHWLGTDGLGRDVWARLVAGTRPAVTGPALIAMITVTLGASLGMLAGLQGGVIDVVISRYVDLVFALPALLLVIVVIGAVGGNYPIMIALYVFFLMPTSIRLSRSATLSQVRLPYVDAARVLGLSTPTVLTRYLFPNIVPTVLATGLIDFVAALVGFSSLSYLGLGVTAGAADWGRVLAEGRTLLLRNPWASVAPAVAIVATAAAVTLLGDWIYERLAHR